MTYFVSTRTISSGLQQSILKLQSELSARTTELSTGKHADLGYALGDRTGLVVSLRSENATLQSFTDTNETIGLRLSTTENLVANIQTSAQDLLNTLLAAGATKASAATIQGAAKTGLKGLIESLNSTLQGDFLFAGTDTGTKPITDYFADSSANKSTVDATFLAAFGFAQSSPDVSTISAGDMQTFLDNQFAAVFQGTSWSESWSSASDQTLIGRISPTETVSMSLSANETPFKELAEAYTMLAEFSMQTLEGNAYEAVTRIATSHLSAAINGLTNLRASIGFTQASVTSATNQMSLQMNLLSTQVGNLERVNSYEVTSRINEIQTQIETSFRLTAQLRELSLVHYL